jgi:anthranilate synthase/aminodeoxychorismate synthase-like glutamine amidotransferase
MKKILIIDNYDSFTYNLYQYCLEINNADIDIFKNDKIEFNQIKQANYDKIIISPGPGDPTDPKYFGVCKQVILELSKEIDILGVCLGHQGIGGLLGGKVVRASKQMHGKTSIINHNGTGVFANLPNNIEVMRYHSLIIDKQSLPKEFEITAVSQDDDEIMGIKHKTLLLEGIQFHPESFGTNYGHQMLANYILR